ncbi:unnamed protein product [Arctia plantaginis]|uniref:RNA-binding protein 48 n=1 Tax=Arctia plantaginis TaxID=874455 RepID=A0A8S0ZP99_ARCPL|nr:unnamed protein product [Arctia plantaginis]
MSNENNQPKLLPHHEQKELCTSRAPYRQGRKLTAVKVYTINNESKHLLIFGVPSLNLRQETKALFMKFGKILQFNKTDYPSEQFTETFHAVYDTINSARIAKKMLDTKNYYGGNLHICYAPEMETVEDVREKMLLRRKQVIGRLKNLDREAELSRQVIENKVEERLHDIRGDILGKDGNSESIEKMNMGTENTIIFGKRKMDDIKKKYIKKHKLSDKIVSISNSEVKYTKTNDIVSNNSNGNSESAILNAGPSTTDKRLNDVEVIDFTSPHTEVLSNINEALNYNNFGTDIIKKVPYKPVNRIKFNVNKKS